MAFTRKIHLYGWAGISALGDGWWIIMQMYSAHQRGERRSKQAEKNTVLFKFFFACFTIWILFQSFLRFFPWWGSPHGSPPHSPLLPLGDDHMFQEPGAAEGVLPLPSPTALSAWPLALVTLGCWALRLCDWGEEMGGAFIATSYCTGLLVSMQGSSGHTHMYTQVHWNAHNCTPL